MGIVVSRTGLIHDTSDMLVIPTIPKQFTNEALPAEPRAGAARE
jgi:hypothetical protein